MRGDRVYRVYGVHEGRARDFEFGAFHSLREAQAEMEKLRSRPDAKEWHSRGFAIREALVETDFEIPSLPKPRDRYAVKTRPQPNRPGSWDSTVVEVVRRDAASGEWQRICEYGRNYAMLHTFEPFRQGGREYALISRSYTKTAVLDLDSGKVIAEEDEAYYDKIGTMPGAGFCPVGFYVPDWWDVNDGSVVPGSEFWDQDDEWPTGDFGFVWGCHWGDDSSWKVQHLDLSRIQQGVIVRDDRFGYVELATIGHSSPIDLSSEAGRSVVPRPPEFIRLEKDGGRCRVVFAAELTFDLTTGRMGETQRKSFAREDIRDP